MRKDYLYNLSKTKCFHQFVNFLCLKFCLIILIRHKTTSGFPFGENFLRFQVSWLLQIFQTDLQNSWVLSSPPNCGGGLHELLYYELEYLVDYIFISLIKGLYSSGVDLRLQLEDAIKRLPERMKACFVLFAVQGMKQTEIAEILEMKLGTVKAHIFQAKEQLRAILSDTEV